MFLYRDHRGGLSESMETVREFSSKDKLFDYLQAQLSEWNKDSLDISDTTIEPYGYDKRIKWDTHIVHLEGWGVFGFTNERVK